MLMLAFSLTHKVENRPKFRALVEHPYIKKIEEEENQVGEWYTGILEKEQALLNEA
jgi:hypothetical protein